SRIRPGWAAKVSHVEAPRPARSPSICNAAVATPMVKSERIRWVMVSRRSLRDPSTIKFSHPSRLPQPSRRLPQHPVEVSVREHPLGVEAVAHGEKVAEARVEPSQRLGVLKVDLAPVRPPPEVAHDLLDSAKVLEVVLAPVPVHRDVARLAAVGGGQPQVVAGRRTHLDRK